MRSIVRIFSIFAAMVLVTTLASADTLELCPGGSFIGSPSAGVAISTAPGSPQCKSKSFVNSTEPQPDNIVYGLGVSGKTVGEIDYREFVTIDFTGLSATGVEVEDFDIIVFYNGPEFGDREEQGSVKVWYAAGPIVTYTFTAELEEVGNGVNQDSGTNGITFTGGGTVTNISPMTQQDAGWFRFSDFPFRGGNVLKLEFTAADLSSSTNNSDYALRSLNFGVPNVEPIPEPATYALMGLGLFALAAWRRTRKA